MKRFGLGGLCRTSGAARPAGLFGSQSKTSLTKSAWRGAHTAVSSLAGGARPASGCCVHCTGTGTKPAFRAEVHGLVSSTLQQTVTAERNGSEEERGRFLDKVAPRTESGPKHGKSLASPKWFPPLVMAAFHARGGAISVVIYFHSQVQRFNTS